MKTIKQFMSLSSLALLGVSLSGCGNSGNSPLPHFVSPQKLMISSRDVTWDGTARRLAYVTNYTTGTITAFDIRNRRILDTDDFDEVETPITVGGNPTAIFEWRPSNLDSSINYRLVVCDPNNQRLHMYNVRNSENNGLATVSFEPVDLGGSSVFLVGTPQFFDRGRASNPSITAITVDTSVAKEENWRLISDGRRSWLLEGSVSGRQNRRVISGEPYQSDDGALSFTIFEFDRRADADDAFYFGVVRSKPMVLADAPAALHLRGNSLYLFMRNLQQLDVIDLNTLTTTASVPINDGSGHPILATDMQSNDSQLVITNGSAGHSVITVDLNTLIATTTNIGAASRSVMINDSTAYLLPIGQRDIFVFALNSLTLSAPSISMGDFPLVGAQLNGDEGVDGDALVVNSNNTVDLMKLSERKRVDTRDRGSIESFAGPVQFFDMHGISNPSVGEIITRDGITRNESWILEYEGVITYPSANTGNVATNGFSDFATDLQNVRAGDLLILQPNRSSHEEILISQVVDANNLVLATTPQNQGVNLDYEIRARGAYTLYGSFSGLQNQRIIEGLSVQSDGGEITFSINPASTASPTTRGDSFTFDTSDGITPIGTNGNFAADIKVFENRAYILNQNSNDITIINIPALEAQSGID